MQSKPATRENSAFLPEVEGLRAIAILLVMVFHARIPWCKGGLLGVDVFFVLSGFLITGLLRRRLLGGSGLDFIDFYARRIRRLLPASSAVLVLSILGGMVFCAPLLSREFADSAFNTALYVGNFWIAIQQKGYLATESEANPFLHYWSLAVEEQFYLVWPLLLWAIHRFTPSRRGAFRVIGLVALSSFALCLLITFSFSRIWSFFLPATRAWEFAAGALVALARERPSRWMQQIRSPLPGWLGLAVLVGLLPFYPSNRHPGIVTLVPVAATLLVLAFPGPAPFGAIRLLGCRAFLWIGRMSYSWYLVHWPLLVFMRVSSPEDGWQTSVPTVLAALGVAWTLHHLVENPVRHMDVLASRRWSWVPLLLALSALPMGAAWIWKSSNEHLLASPSQSDLLAASRSSSLSSRCLLDYDEANPRRCSQGAVGGKGPLIYLFGDSHAAHWIPAIAEAAASMDGRLVVHAKSACPVVDLPGVQNKFGTLYRECVLWKQSVMAEMAAANPDLIFITSAYAGDAGKWGAGLGRVLPRIAALSPHVIYLQDTPRGTEDHLACLSEQHHAPWRTPGDCKFDANDSSRMRYLAAEAVPLRSFGGQVVDLAKLVCPDGVCPEYAGGLPVWRDRSHLAESWVRAQSSFFRDLVGNALAPHGLRAPAPAAN